MIRPATRTHCAVVQVDGLAVRVVSGAELEPDAAAAVAELVRAMHRRYLSDHGAPPPALAAGGLTSARETTENGRRR